MNLRKTSFQIIERELKPYFLEAIKFHPKTVDIKVVRGNPVTVHDYARRILIKARKEGIGPYSADHIQALQPRLRIYYSSGGISIAAMKQKRVISKEWDKYDPPFDVLPDDSARWPMVINNPDNFNLQMILAMRESGVIQSPLEIHGRSIADVRKIVSNSENNGLSIFQSGRNVMIWGNIKYNPARCMGKVKFKIGESA